ncbi:MAG TPA: hypothetical protein EYQ00_08495 [Dehalococcoidia bacterium]|nr:hypothetical protein [Dehalococcoidia bacterium]
MDKLPGIGDLVWCQNGVKKNMGIVSSFDPDRLLRDGERRGEDYCWVTLIEGSPGQPKWTKLKTLILVKENEDR